MLWVFVLIGTAGFVALVPALLRAIDNSDTPTSIAEGIIGFGGSGFAVTGLLAGRFTSSGLLIFIAALAVGLASAAVHPEALASLRRDGHTNAESASDASR